MKSKFLFIVLFFILSSRLLCEEIFIQAQDISISKKDQITVFENNVVIKTQDNKTIKSNYAEYDKINQFIIIKGNVTAVDDSNNFVNTENATYDEKNKLFTSIGKTSITTTENYKLFGEDVFFDDINKKIYSRKKTKLQDTDKNNIFLDNFDYSIKDNIFKSVGSIFIEDINNNNYEFSQIYIDTKKKKILGTDIKAKIEQEEFKPNKSNKPRVFANTMEMEEKISTFKKSIFTICDYRANDKCPPWTIQAGKMLHDNEKKTIYYDNALIKIYDVPIFYFPKLSHPDPSVDRRSGFLVPTFHNTKNLGEGISVPYFFDISPDKNFTITNRLYVQENPLFLGEFHQAFNNASLIADFGYTEGYKKTSSSKKAGEKSHFFTRFVKKFISNDGSNNTFSFRTQEVSNDKYLKLYKLETNLIDHNKNTLENSLDFTKEKDDLYIGFNASIYESIKENYNDKYEYIFPNITVDKNIFINEFGNLNLQSNFKSQNYDTNKLKSFFINDLNYNSNLHKIGSVIGGEFQSHLKNINYETKNVDEFKDDFTSEIYGALGYLAKIDLFKNLNNTDYFLTPKFFLRYAPGGMRKELSGERLSPEKAFDIDRSDIIDNFETGLSGSVGLDYKLTSNKKEFDFSVAQVINEEENKKKHSKSSLDEKLSDLVGSSSFKINEKMTINHNFALDQNYQDFNYNEFGMSLDFGNSSINFDYLKENNHVGNQEYFVSKVNFFNKDNKSLSFETKRNLITNSSEFYDLSYEYANDCLRAGLVYRREFYKDSELEPENSLMFKITLVPFGNVLSPSFNK